MEPLGQYYESEDGHLVLLGRWPGRQNRDRLFGFYRDALFHDLRLSHFAFHSEDLRCTSWRPRSTSILTMNYIRQGLIRALYCVELQRRESSIWFPEADFGTPGRRALSIASRLIRCELRATIR